MEMSIWHCFYQAILQSLKSLLLLLLMERGVNILRANSTIIYIFRNTHTYTFSFSFFLSLALALYGGDNRNKNLPAAILRKPVMAYGG